MLIRACHCRSRQVWFVWRQVMAVIKVLWKPTFQATL